MRNWSLQNRYFERCHRRTRVRPHRAGCGKGGFGPAIGVVASFFFVDRAQDVRLPTLETVSSLAVCRRPERPDIERRTKIGSKRQRAMDRASRCAGRNKAASRESQQLSTTNFHALLCSECMQGGQCLR